jgi:hypothetical protein
MDMIRLDEIPPPPGALRGRYVYVTGRPAPVWAENREREKASITWGRYAWLVLQIAAALAGIAALFR